MGRPYARTTYFVGRKMPEMVTMSPGPHSRVVSPLQCTTMVRGMWPMGTCSDPDPLAYA